VRDVDARRAAGEVRLESQPAYVKWARRDHAGDAWRRSCTELDAARAAAESARAAQQAADEALEQVLPPLRSDDSPAARNRRRRQ
jgi:hypothetical protein